MLTNPEKTIDTEISRLVKKQFKYDLDIDEHHVDKEKIENKLRTCRKIMNVLLPLTILLLTFVVGVVLAKIIGYDFFDWDSIVVPMIVSLSLGANYAGMSMSVERIQFILILINLKETMLQES